MVQLVFTGFIRTTIGQCFAIRYVLKTPVRTVVTALFLELMAIFHGYTVFASDLWLRIENEMLIWRLLINSSVDQVRIIRSVDIDIVYRIGLFYFLLSSFKTHY